MADNMFKLKNHLNLVVLGFVSRLSLMVEQKQSFLWFVVMDDIQHG